MRYAAMLAQSGVGCVARCVHDEYERANGGVRSERTRPAAQRSKARSGGTAVRAPVRTPVYSTTQHTRLMLASYWRMDCTTHPLGSSRVHVFVRAPATVEAAHA